MFKITKLVVKKKLYRYILLSVIALIIIVSIIVGFAGRFKNRIKVIAESDTLALSQVSDTTLPPFTYYYDFEGISSPENDKVLYKGIAFSGKTSTKAFGNNSFSLIIEKSVKDIGIANLTKVSMSGQIYLFKVRDSVKSALVFSILKPDGESVYWQGVGINGKGNIPVEQWFNVSGDFRLNDVKLSPDDKIRIYLWNNSNNDMLLDDLYVVYGEEADRRGEKTYCDLTVAPFKGYGPPFPVLYLVNYDIGNNNSRFLINNELVRHGDLIKENNFITGYFLERKGGLQSLITVGKGLALYHYCPGNKAFVYGEINSHGAVFPSGKGLVATGDYNGDGYDEIFVNNKSGGFSLYEIIRINNICNKNNKINLREIWSGKTDDFLKPPFIAKTTELYSADFDNDNRSELLLVDNTGRWKIMKWSGKSLYEYASGASEWFNKDKYFINIYAGALPVGYDKQGVLTYGCLKNTLKPVNNLLVFSGNSKTFIPFSLKNKQGLIFLSGNDTLKYTDRLFSVIFLGKRQLLRYNDDWRFDMKLADYSSDTLKVKYDVDFKGYRPGENPKYYEYVNMITGNFVNPSYTSLILITGNYNNKGVNYEDRNFIDEPGFPVRVQLYSPGFRK